MRKSPTTHPSSSGADAASGDSDAVGAPVGVVGVAPGVALGPGEPVGAGVGARRVAAATRTGRRTVSIVADEARA